MKKATSPKKLNRSTESLQNRRRVRITVYLDPQDVTTLGIERLRRIDAGLARRKADVSVLIREAVRLAFGQKR